MYVYIYIYIYACEYFFSLDEQEKKDIFLRTYIYGWLLMRSGYRTCSHTLYDKIKINIYICIIMYLCIYIYIYIYIYLYIYIYIYLLIYIYIYLYIYIYIRIFVCLCVCVHTICFPFQNSDIISLRIFFPETITFLLYMLKSYIPFK